MISSHQETIWQSDNTYLFLNVFGYDILKIPIGIKNMNAQKGYYIFSQNSAI